MMHTAKQIIEQLVRPPTDQMPPRRSRIPAVVVYIAAILALASLFLMLLPKLVVVTKNVETRFQEALVEVKSNHGDVLEVATYQGNEFFTESDRLDITVLGLPVSLGTTEAFLRVPVTYRFHVLLSDRWQIRTTPETVTVIAPKIRPSLPPAPNISQMEIQSTRGWARFNRNDVEERVKSMVTNILNVRAQDLARSQLIRDASRHSIESALKQWIPWLPEACQNKVFIIRFADEMRNGEATPPAKPEPGRASRT